jgi:hypothetical protein
MIPTLLLTLILSVSAVYADPPQPTPTLTPPCTTSPAQSTSDAPGDLSTQVASVTGTLTSPSHEDFVDAMATLGRHYDSMKRQMDVALKKRNLAGLSDPDEIMAVYLYTTSAYYDINAHLRKGRGSEIQAYLDTAKIALNRLPPYSGTTFRGASLPQDALDLHQVGNIIQYPAFLSTSRLNPFGGKQRISILSKTGRDISEFSNSKAESEVLFHPGSKFKVLERKLNPGDVRETIVLEEVPDATNPIIIP